MKIKVAPQTSRLNLTREQKLAIYTRDKFKCTLCNKNLSKSNSSEIKTARFYIDEHIVLPNHYITICAPRCEKTGVLTLTQYRSKVLNSLYFEDMKTHLHQKLNILQAKRILAGVLPGVNPWDVERINKIQNKGVRPPESTTRGNQNIGRVVRLAIYIRDDFKCLYCMKSLKKEKPTGITLNCFIPVPKGKRIPENLVAACRLCSLKKRGNDWQKKLKKEGRLWKVQRNLDQPLGVYKTLAKAILAGESNAFPNPWRKDSEKDVLDEKACARLGE